MATYTHKQPYGPLARRSRSVDGEVYDVVRGDLYSGQRKYYLRRQGIPGPPEAYVFVMESEDSNTMMKDAMNRLLGPA